MLGVTPTSGGFAGFDVVPHPGDLQWAQGRIPTPHGAIDVAWQAEPNRFRLQAAVPAGTSARLAVPTFGAAVKVRSDGRFVPAHEDGGYVSVSNVGPGQHVLEALRVSPVPTSLHVVATPAVVDTSAGASVSVSADVSGTGQGATDVQVSAGAPAGWTVTPAERTLTLGDHGRPAAGTAEFTVAVPASTRPGSYQVTVSAQAPHGSARDTVAVTIEAPGYRFDSSTMGWQPGTNATGVAEVTSFADRPGSCVSGGCLEVRGASVPATAVRSAYVEPATPIDMSGAGTFSLAFDCYGGVPGATGYQAIVTLTGSNGDVLTKTFPVSSDTWSTLSVPLTGWSGAGSVRRIEVGFAAVGTSYSPWGANFQIDNVTSS